METSELKAILTSLREAQQFLTLDPEEYPSVTKHGLMIKRRQVEQEVGSLRGQAREAIQAAGEAVCFIGDATKLIDEARTKGGVVAVDASAIYREIASEIEKTLSPTREWTSNQTSAIATEIYTRVADVDPYNRPDLSTPADLRPFVVGRGEQLVQTCRRYVREMNGDRLAGEFIAKQLLDGALAATQAGGDVPQLIVHGVGSQAEAHALASWWPFDTIVDPKLIKRPTK